MKIAIYPGKFKPPHKGHFFVAKQLADRPDIDKVIIAIGNTAVEGVTAQQSADVWEIYIPLISPKIEIIKIEGSPVKYVYRQVKDNPDINYVVAYGKGESSRYDALQGVNNVEIFDAGNADNISATNFRIAIQARNITQIENFLPADITVQEFFDAFNKVYNGNKEPINESLHKQHFPLLKEFIGYCREYLKLKSLPPLKMSYDPTTAESRRSFGGYDPNNKSIELSVANRHQADVFRTLAHELVHYKQDTQNRLTPESGKTGHQHENEANAAAAIIMRNFAQMRPEMFIVK